MFILFSPPCKRHNKSNATIVDLLWFKQVEYSRVMIVALVQVCVTLCAVMLRFIISKCMYMCLLTNYRMWINQCSLLIVIAGTCMLCNTCTAACMLIHCLRPLSSCQQYTYKGLLHVHLEITSLQLHPHHEMVLL